MIHLLKDSRDIIFSKRYGQTIVFPREYNTDTSHIDVIQPYGDVSCTAITVCDIAGDKFNNKYDWKELYSRVPKTQWGADPRDVLKETVKNGLKLFDGNVEKKFKSYWRADKGGMDAFDNIRSALMIAESPIALCTPWYAEWINKSILTKGEIVTNNHMYSCEGWTEIDGVEYLIIDAWVGYKQYMSRDECNRVMKYFQSQAWVLSIDEPIKIYTQLLKILLDKLINYVTLLNKTMKKEDILTITKSLIGKRLTLDPKIPKEVGCAQAVSYILKEAGYPIPKGGISGTYTLEEFLKKHFWKTDKIKPGNLIISTTGTGNGVVKHGHTGVFTFWDGKNGRIASNDSDSGLLEENWAYDKWIKNYVTKGKLRTTIYEPKA